MTLRHRQEPAIVLPSLGAPKIRQEEKTVLAHHCSQAMQVPLGWDFQGPAVETCYAEGDLLWAVGSS